MKKINYFLTTLIIIICQFSYSRADKVNRKVSTSSKSIDLSQKKANEIAGQIVSNQKSRIKDAFGSGQYGASRDKNTRIHQGLDIIVQPGEKIFSPFEATIVREATPYKNDPSFRGVVLKGIGLWIGYEVKIFYVEGILLGQVILGQDIGTAQNLAIKYPKITNHVHVEVKKYGNRIDPFELWQISF